MRVYLYIKVGSLALFLYFDRVSFFATEILMKGKYIYNSLCKIMSRKLHHNLGK